jgi:ribosomal protein S20
LTVSQQLKKELKQLTDALQTGNLTGAQQAYSALQQLDPNKSQDSSGGNSTNPIRNDLKAVGQALQSGDLSGAQSAFSQLQTDLKAAADQNGASPGNALAQALKSQGQTSSAPVASSVSGSSSGSPVGQTINILA